MGICRFLCLLALYLVGEVNFNERSTEVVLPFDRLLLMEGKVKPPLRSYHVGEFRPELERHVSFDF